MFDNSVIETYKEHTQYVDDIQSQNRILTVSAKEQTGDVFTHQVLPIDHQDIDEKEYKDSVIEWDYDTNNINRRRESTSFSYNPNYNNFAAKQSVDMSPKMNVDYSNEYLFSLRRKANSFGQLEPIRKNSNGLPINMFEQDKYLNHLNSSTIDIHKVKERNRLNDHSISIKTLQQLYRFDCERGLSKQQVVENRTLKTKNQNQLVKMKQTGSKWEKIQDLMLEYKFTILLATIIFFVSFHNYIQDPSQILLGLLLICILIVERKKSYNNNIQQKTMELMKDLIPDKCTVIRDGKEQDIIASNIVLGDIIILKPNIVVPVDCRVLKINKTEEIQVIQCDQSLLFQGKLSSALNKICNYPTNFLKSANIALQGSKITKGSGKAIAIMTQTESHCYKTISQSFQQIQNLRKQSYPIQTEIFYFVRVLSYVSIFFALLFLLISYFQFKTSIITSFIFAGSVLVAFIPSGLITQIQIAKFMRDTSKSRLNYTTLKYYFSIYMLNFIQNIRNAVSFVINYFKFTSQAKGSQKKGLNNNFQSFNKNNFEINQYEENTYKYNFISFKKEQNSENLFHINDYEKSIEKLGQVSCICSDLSQLIDYSKSEVNGMWINGSIIASLNNIIENEINNFKNKTYQNLILASILANESSFSSSPSKIDLQQLPFEDEGSYIDTALIKFCESICDVNITRQMHPKAVNQNGNLVMIPYDQNTKLTIVVVEEKYENYDYVLYVKGSPEKIWKLCQNIEINGDLQHVSEDLMNQFHYSLKSFRQKGETVVAIAKLPLVDYNFKFGNLNDFFDKDNKLNIKITNLTLLGLVSIKNFLYKDIKYHLNLTKFSGTKLIMHSDHDARTTLALAIESGLIPEQDFQQGELLFDKYDENSKQKDYDEKISQNINSKSQKNMKNIEQPEDNTDKAYFSQWNKSAKKASYIIVSGNRLDEYIEANDKKYDECILEWLNKEMCIFSNINNQQKQKIIPFLHKLNQTIAVTSNDLENLQYLNSADISIAGVESCYLLKRLSDIYLIRNKFQPDIQLILKAIEEGVQYKENAKKIFAFHCSTKMAQIIPLITSIILRIPLSISAMFMILISYIINFIPAISLARENPDIDILFNQYHQKTFQKKRNHVVTFRLIFYSYFFIGIISSAAGFCAFFTTMNHSGFPINTLFGMLNQKGYSANQHMPLYMGYDDDVVNNYLQTIEPHFDIPAHTIIETHMPHWNSLFMMPDGDCEEDLHKYVLSHKMIDWNNSLSQNVDLRKFYVYCDKQDKKWKTSLNWSYCDSKNYINYSTITGNSICYTSEAFNYGQTAYFLGVVFFQFSNLFALKSLRQSFVQSSYNGLLVFSIIIQVILCIFLVQIPGIQNIFRTRSLHFFQWGLPAIPFSILILMHEEIRKFLARNFIWFKKVASL